MSVLANYITPDSAFIEDVLASYFDAGDTGKPTKSIHTSFTAAIQQQLLDLVQKPKPYKSPSDCLEHCIGGSEAGGDKCKLCQNLMAKPEQRLNAGQDEPLYNDEAVPIVDVPTCEDRGDCEIPEQAANPFLDTPNVNETPPSPQQVASPKVLGPQEDYDCKENQFLRLGNRRIKATAHPLCETDALHGMKFECAKHSLGKAIELCNLIDDCHAVTGEKGVYYLRDGFGSKSDILGWITCGKTFGNQPAVAPAKPPDKIMTKWSIPDAMTVG